MYKAGTRLEVMRHLEPVIAEELPNLLRDPEHNWQPMDFSPDLNTEEGFEEVRGLQAEARAISDDAMTVLVGDMNALFGSREIQMILEAGFVDAWSESGQPERPRIDWIFHTPDLVARDVVVIESPASDHPAFAATIGPRR